MGRLSKSQLDRRSEVVTNIRTAHEALEKELTDINAEIASLNERLDHAFGEYNSVVTEAETLRDEIVGDLQTEYDEKSEKWQEGEKGEAMQSAISDWENVNVEEATFDTIDEIEIPTPDAADELEQAPEEW